VAEDDDDIQRPEDVLEATDEQLAVWRDIYRIAQRRRTNPTEESDEGADEEEEKEIKDRLLELWILPHDRRPPIRVATIEFLRHA
jgi:hypothetical protein